VISFAGAKKARALAAPPDENAAALSAETGSMSEGQDAGNMLPTSWHLGGSARVNEGPGSAILAVHRPSATCGPGSFRAVLTS